MELKKLMIEAENIAQELTAHRRWLHSHAETGFALEHTIAYVENALQNMGIPPVRMGKMGLCAKIEGQQPGKVFLLRADMDALPIQEKSGEAFACQNGNMHACGHDMHTAMLLGAAKLLKANSGELRGTVRLMFQPAEELFLGAEDMIASGILDHVSGAMMLHVVTGVPLAAGTPIVPNGGIGAPSADCFTIEISGKGCHGAAPQLGIDPITAAAHIILGLQEITARELDSAESVVLTVGSVQAGNAPNVIPDKAVLSGSVRAYQQDVRRQVKSRIEQVSTAIATAYRAEVQISFANGCPPFMNDPELCVAVKSYLSPLLDSLQKVSAGSDGNIRQSRGGGSEDFAFVSQKVPAIMVALVAGAPDKGYHYPLHHPMVRFDESALPKGSAILAGVALNWLNEQRPGD